MRTTTIQIPIQLRERLNKLKDHPRQPYAEVIDAVLNALGTGPNFDDEDRVQLGTAIESLAVLEEYASYGKARYDREPMLRDAILMRIKAVHTSLARLSPEFRKDHSSVPWEKNLRLARDTSRTFPAVSPAVVWTTINGPLRQFGQQAAKVHEMLER